MARLGFVIPADVDSFPRYRLPGKNQKTARMAENNSLTEISSVNIFQIKGWHLACGYINSNHIF